MLTLDFANGGDTASFTGRALTGITAMPLAQNLAGGRIALKVVRRVGKLQTTSRRK